MQPSATAIPSTYTTLRSGTRTAQALYESDYNDAYVYNALREKGYDHRQSIWCMRNAEAENVEQRKKTSLLGVIIFGSAWIVIFTIMYFSADAPQSRSMVQYEVVIPLKWWLIAGGVFLGSLINYIYAARQVARVKKKLPESPEGIGVNEPL